MLLSRTVTGDAIVETAQAADFLKVTAAEEHEQIAAMVEAATLYAESFCGRDLRKNQYELLRTDFGEIDLGFFPLTLSSVPLNIGFIPVRRATINTIDEVAYLLSGTFTVIATSVYYASIELSKAKVLLQPGEAWPTDADSLEDNVRIKFTMKEPLNIEIARAGILRHVALMYADRGDAEPAMSASGPSSGTTTLALVTARQSGAEGFYHQLQIPSV